MVTIICIWVTFFNEVIMGIKNRRAWSITIVIAIAVLAVACAGAAPATPVPTTQVTTGDAQRIVPTTATESWEQLAPNKWRFQLRQGVKFHNGEAWNAQAALPSLAYQGVADNDNSSVSYTAGYKAEAVGEYTVNITCDQACSIFPNSTIFLNFLAPEFYTSSSDETLSREVIGFGPYKLVEWQPGVELTQEAYEDYVPAGHHL